MAPLRWPLRQRLRFSVRGMLAVLTIGCLLLGCQVEKRRRMMIAVGRAKAAGCYVHSFQTEIYDLPYDPSALLTRFWNAEMWPSAVLANDVREERAVVAISQLTTIKKLEFFSPDPCVDWLRHLEPLQSLRTLYLDCPKLTDHAIPHLCKLKGLEEIWVFESGMTADGILRLRRGLPNCAFRIWVQRTPHSDDYPPLNGRIVVPPPNFEGMYQETR